MYDGVPSSLVLICRPLAIACCTDTHVAPKQRLALDQVRDITVVSNSGWPVVGEHDGRLDRTELKVSGGRDDTLTCMHLTTSYSRTAKALRTVFLL
jgi:hypothetical protein